MQGSSRRREGEIVEAIRAQFNRENDRNRWCAVKALGRLDAREVLPDFIDGLGRDPDPDVRMEIAAVLGTWGGPDAIDALIGTLNGDLDDDVRLQACRALGQIRDPRVVQVLIDCLMVNDDLSLGDWDTGDDIGFSVAWELQREALEGLARIGGEGVVEATIQLLSTEDDDDLEGLGLRVLARIGGQRALDFVIEQLVEGHRTARRQAAKALAQAPGETAIPPLLAALEDVDADVRIAAGWSLVSRTDSALCPTLIKLLQDAEASVRVEAVKMVSNLSAPEVVNALIRLAYDPERAVQQQAIQALGAHCETRASANLLALLARSQKDDVLAHTLITALGRIKAVEALEPLGRLLTSGRLPSTTRMQAVLALGEIAADAAVGACPAEVDPIDILADLVADENLEVGQAALLALSRIGGEQANATLINALRGDLPAPACDAEDEGAASTFPTSTLEAIQTANAPETKLAEDAFVHRQQIRAYAARVLSDLDLPQAWALLRQAAQDDDPKLRCAALLALSRTSGDDEVVAIVAQGICDASGEVRIAALQALGHMPAAQAMHLLLERLTVEPDPLVKAHLLEIAGRIGDRRATASLIATLDDDDRHVQRAALEALARLADRTAIAAVRPLLFAHGGALWREALTTLQHLQDPELDAYLLDTLRKPEQEEYHGIAIDALAFCDGTGSKRLGINAWKLAGRLAGWSVGRG